MQIDPLSHGLGNGLLTGVLVGLSIALNYGLTYGLIGGFLGGLLLERSRAIQVTDRLIWSWSNLIRGLRSLEHVKATLQIMAYISLSFVLSGSLLTLSLLMVGQSSNANNWLYSSVGIGLIGGLSYWLLLGLFQGVSGETIEDRHRMIPNQGVHRSAFNSLILGLTSAMIVGLCGGLISELNNRLVPAPGPDLGIGTVDQLSGGLIFGVSVGLLAGLFNGGLAYLRHYILRFLLWQAGSTPWNYARFLDEAAAYLLLRKVGGGYIFLHRLLLDYFAALEAQPVPDASATDLQGASTTLVSPSLLPSEPSVRDVFPDLPTLPSSLPSTNVPSDVSYLLPCGHESRTTKARFCSVCGAPVL